MPRSAIVVTGSELVRGDRHDLNGPFLAAELVRLGLEPERIVFVDDLPGNLKPAAAIGMATVLHRDAATTLEELERHLGVSLR